MPRRFSRTLVILAWAAASVACGAAAAVTAPTPVAPVTGQAANQSPSTIVLTGETLQLYAVDPGSAHLSGPGFDFRLCERHPGPPGVVRDCRVRGRNRLGVVPRRDRGRRLTVREHLLRRRPDQRVASSSRPSLLRHARRAESPPSRSDTPLISGPQFPLRQISRRLSARIRPRLCPR